MIDQIEIDAWTRFMAAAIAAGREHDDAVAIADKATNELNSKIKRAQQQQQPQEQP